jgi:hypothetical protein
MMKLAVLGAVASMCIRNVRIEAAQTSHDYLFCFLVAAVITPLALAIVTFPLVRSGPLVGSLRFQRSTHVVFVDAQ